MSRTVLAACLAFWLLPAGDGLASGTPARRPNVLFVVADDQRFDTVGALGIKEIRTPNLDRLVGRGFAFSNAYCQGGLVPAVCAPSRTMLMTGKSLFRIPPPRTQQYDGPTLGSVFRVAGYATLFIGKRGNSFLAGNEAFETVVYHEGAGKDGPAKEKAGRAYASKFMADRAIDWLKRRPKDRPFCVYLGPPVPHDPRVAPPEFMKLYDPAKVTLSPNFLPEHPFDNGELKIRDELLAPHPRTPEVMTKHLAEYYACITYLDDQLGRVLAALAEAGELDNTVIVFTSDQGLAVGGRHGLMGKQNLYEEFKSPLILAGPGVPHGRSDALVYLFDLFPTVCELTGQAVPKVCEGASLVPVLRGQRRQVRDVLFAAYRDCQRMVREERWKLIWYPKIDRYQLFDLKNDPWEIRDLHASPGHGAEFQRLKAQLARQQEIWGDDQAPRPRLARADTNPGRRGE